MGSSKSSSTQNTNYNQSTSQTSNERFNQGSSGYQQTHFDPRSWQEKSILDQYQGLGDSQSEYIRNLVNGNSSPFALSEADQSLLDQSYNAARERLMLGGKDYADYLATTRGLNKSDTPVSLQAMDRFGQSLSDLESQKANAALNLGLQGNSMRFQAAQALPAGLGAAFMPMFNERMAGGRTTMGQDVYGSSNGSFYNNTSGNQNSTTTQRFTPSLMQQIGQGMSLASQGIGLGAQMYGMMSGVPTTSFLGGLGSAQTGIPVNPTMYSSPIGPVKP